MGKILVTGGCGYIGSHTVVDLLEKGYDVICVDNLHNASDDVMTGIEKITGQKIRNCVADVSDWNSFGKIFENEPEISAIIHFAALKSVEDSTNNPNAYYLNNIGGMMNVIRAAEEFQIDHVIFSSSCTVYGNVKELPVTETSPFGRAESPYGATKQVAEIMLDSYYMHAKNGSGISLRYFNPAGAHESGEIGESPSNKASNLVPVITETAVGKRKSMTVFGNDYDTRDGSCIRDYIHVMDLAEAHTLALKYLEEDRNEAKYEVFNLGIGAGVSVLEAIHAFEKTARQKLNYKLGPRRAGDVIAIYANNEKSSKALKWNPKRNIDQIMETAWNWEKTRTSE